MSYREVLTVNKNINEAEVVLLTKVACEAKQHENIQKNIVISGLPECTSSEVKERIESERAAANKLVVFVNKDRTTAERIFEKQLRTKRDSLNSQLEETQSVNGIDRKYGVYEGRNFGY